MVNEVIEDGRESDHKPVLEDVHVESAFGQAVRSRSEALLHRLTQLRCPRPSQRETTVLRVLLHLYNDKEIFTSSIILKPDKLRHLLCWKSAVVVCVPPETFNLLDRGTAETCAVLPPASIAFVCISVAAELPFVRLM
jgi:hypothetical protein